MIRPSFVILGCMFATAVPADHSYAHNAPAPAQAPPVAVATPALPTPELSRVWDELRRGVAQLRLDDIPAPYRAEARIVRAELLSLDGSYGGLISNVSDRQSAGAIEIRIGSPQRDNTNFFGGDSGIAPMQVALDADAPFAAQQVWLGLDRAFRGASRAWTQKQMALQRLADTDHPPDYTQVASPSQFQTTARPSHIDREGLAAMVESLSARFAEHPTINNGDVHVQVLRTTETVINTEGNMLQWTRDRAFLAVTADTKAADGMALDHGLAIHLAEVPAANDELLGRGEQLVDRVLGELEELAAAPMLDEDYDGPILFVGPSAPQLLATTVATEAVGTPAPLSDSGRMTDLEPAWQTRLGKQVLPPFIDLVDDPDVPGGFGNYQMDAEGVRPLRLRLVESGRLNTLLMTRSPNSKLSGSNGRARMSPSLEVAATISNLSLVSKRHGASTHQLERELLRRAQEDGYDFAYIVESLRDGSVLGPVTRESATAYAGTGTVNLPLPARVFRVDASGRRTLVRGAVLAPASIRALRRIRAVGLDPTTLALRIPVGAFGGFGADVGIDGALSQTVDVQVSSPSLLIEGLELLVERGEHQRLPTLQHPLRRSPVPPIEED